MGIYSKIKKEHLFVFLILFAALTIFTYWDSDFNYIGLTTKSICTDTGYKCCIEGEGTNYFSLDYSCSGNQQCWTSCSEKKEKVNQITGNFNLIDTVNNWWDELTQGEIGGRTLRRTTRNICGDGNVSNSEECDGVNLGGATCQSLGYIGENLACVPNQCVFDLNECIKPELPSQNQRCEDRTLYGSCQRRDEKLYCGFEENLISNGGFELGEENWLFQGTNTPEVIHKQVADKKNEGLKSYYLKIPENINLNTYFISLYQDIDVEPNKYYKLSFYASTKNLRGNNPISHINCFTEDNKKIYIDETENQDFFEVGDLNRKISGSRFTQYEYTFLAPWNAEYCRVQPAMFFKGTSATDSNGGNGELWIDSIRFEKINEEPTLTADCGVCGCPNDSPYCTIDGTCSDVQPEGVIEDCENNLDDDLDGIADEFDSDCENEEIDEHYLVSLKKNGLKILNNEPYTESKITVDCSYNVFNFDEETPRKTNDIIDNSLKCIELDEIECEEKVYTNAGGFYNAKFLDCDVGFQTGEKTITCLINDQCNQEVLNDDYDLELQKTINVKEFNYCSNGDQGSLTMSPIEVDDSFQTGDTIEITANVNNFGDEERVITKAALIDLNTGNKIKEATSQEILLGEREEGEFNIELVIPSFTTSAYRLYVKSYVKDSERTECVQEFSTVNIERLEGDEENNDEPITEPDESACEAGEIADCNTILEGICSEGVQICGEDNLWEECQQSKRPRTEIPNNQLDDDCDGETDESIPQQNERDSDNDNLPDSWEIQYFGSVNLQGSQDDYDNDGITNYQEFTSNKDPTNSSDGKKSGNLLWLWITLGIILMIIILFFLIKLISKPKNKGNYTDPRLNSYVQDSLRKGFTKNQIKQALLSKGWSQSEIDKILR